MKKTLGKLFLITDTQLIIFGVLSFLESVNVYFIQPMYQNNLESGSVLYTLIFNLGNFNHSLLAVFLLDRTLQLFIKKWLATSISVIATCGFFLWHEWYDFADFPITVITVILYLITTYCLEQKPSTLL